MFMVTFETFLYMLCIHTRYPIQLYNTYPDIYIFIVWINKHTLPGSYTEPLVGKMTFIDFSL